jgi:hypothetical protein
LRQRWTFYLPAATDPIPLQVNLFSALSQDFPEKPFYNGAQAPRLAELNKDGMDIFILHWLDGGVLASHHLYGGCQQPPSS